MNASAPNELQLEMQFTYRKLRYPSNLGRWNTTLATSICTPPKAEVGTLAPLFQGRMLVPQKGFDPYAKAD